MTSAAADVISVPSVFSVTLFIFVQWTVPKASLNRNTICLNGRVYSMQHLSSKMMFYRKVPWHDHKFEVLVTLHWRIMGSTASQITSLTVVYSTVYSDADQRKYQSFASLAFLWGIHRRPVNSPHKWPVTRKMFPFDDVIMSCLSPQSCTLNFSVFWYHTITQVPAT